MAEITLAKALKVKNRLAGRLAKVQADIQAFNSVPEGQADQVRSSFITGSDLLKPRFFRAFSVHMWPENGL